MLSRPYLNPSIILPQSSLSHESYVEQYATNAYFKDVYDALTHGS